MKKILIALSLVCICIFSLRSEEKVTIDGITYTLHGNGTKGKLSVKVQDKNQLPANLEIPPSIIINNREYPVTEIEKIAFEECDNLVSIILPNTVNKIGVLRSRIVVL